MSRAAARASYTPCWARLRLLGERCMLMTLNLLQTCASGRLNALTGDFEVCDPRCDCHEQPTSLNTDPPLRILRARDLKFCVRVHLSERCSSVPYWRCSVKYKHVHCLYDPRSSNFKISAIKSQPKYRNKSFGFDLTRTRNFFFLIPLSKKLA